ncbi:MAG: hypothetical protein Satyrvirus6_2 [Satyrvirus sp.]|uniref:Uncharacterized protein n=1 Tax=Satyrvirus sp. TaxID=2487771 RepID=A0A3G5ADC0_9VIRU|nr:MAG: hypothetical protein Satyrvirus6_2 [Satyrvirus sp.]
MSDTNNIGNLIVNNTNAVDDNNDPMFIVKTLSGEDIKMRFVRKITTNIIEEAIIDTNDCDKFN